MRAGERAPETVHREMERGMVVVDSTEKFADFDIGVEFFVYLATQGLVGSFSVFDLTTGKLPPIFPFAVASLGRKNAALVVEDDGGYYFNRFNSHFPQFISLRVGQQAGRSRTCS